MDGFDKDMTICEILKKMQERDVDRYSGQAFLQYQLQKELVEKQDKFQAAQLGKTTGLVIATWVLAAGTWLLAAATIGLALSSLLKGP